MDKKDIEKAAEKVAADTQLNVTAATLAEAIVKATELASGRRRVIPFGQHVARTAFNPTGRVRKLEKEFYQNGGLMHEETLTDAEIDLLHQIEPGKYIDKMVTVQENVTPSGNKVYISYNNATAEQRMILGMRVGSLTGMLQQIIAEAKEQKAAAKQARKREIEDALNS